MGKLADWSQKNSKFLNLQDGESVTAIFRGYKEITSAFDPDKEAIRYKLDTKHGEKLWDTSAKGVALFFDDVKAGQKVLIKRSGTATETKYELSLVETDSE